VIGSYFSNEGLSHILFILNALHDRHRSTFSKPTGEVANSPSTPSLSLSQLFDTCHHLPLEIYLRARVIYDEIRVCDFRSDRKLRIESGRRISARRLVPGHETLKLELRRAGGTRGCPGEPTHEDERTVTRRTSTRRRPFPSTSTDRLRSAAARPPQPTFCLSAKP
jgi:hypothetical protein